MEYTKTFSHIQTIDSVEKCHLTKQIELVVYILLGLHWVHSNIDISYSLYRNICGQQALGNKDICGQEALSNEGSIK